MKNRIAVGAFAAVMVVGAITAPEAKAASSGLNDSGTGLTVTVGTPVAACRADGTGADVSYPYSVTSTGSADSAVVTVTINGVAHAAAVIQSGNVLDGGGWNFAGRTKSASGSFALFLPDSASAYNGIVCATQSGAGGRLPKSGCGSYAAVTVNCPDPPPVQQNSCSASFKGAVVGNNSCPQSGTLEVQFDGDFGALAILTITGPNGYLSTALVGRNGNSCQYHGHSWNFGGLPNGNYTLTATGNGNTVTMVKTLSCN